MIKEHKKELVIVGLILLFIIALIGVSYAAFSYSKTGGKVNTITTGSITMTYEETDNTIFLNGALPTTDKTGMVRLNDGEYFDFSISSEITGNVNINYEISAKDVTDSSARKIDGKYIKLYLTELVGGKEEALMLPEVYNEETLSNTYTGRPAEEMSLYTSSMNSSEEHQYRLRMYVDESYNPQGDGGGLTFSVKINVYGKDGDKYVPLTTRDILEDNEVQEEKTTMFNYASNGGYFDMSSGSPSVNPEYITNGLYSMEDEDGVSYYFRGNVDNNNVQFGEYKEDYYVYNTGSRYFQSLESCQEYSSSCSESNRVKLASKGDKMYWKLVRVNGDGSLRLIYNGTSTTPDNSDLANSYVVGYTPYDFSYNDPKYTGYTYDNGTDSVIKKEVDTWYSKALGNTEYDSKVMGGRFCSDSSGYKSSTEYGMEGEIFPANTYFFASWGDRLAQAFTNYSKPNEPTLKCPATSESYGGSYRLKAGLITADELVLAGENPGVTTDSYLNPGEDRQAYYWTMTPAGFSNSGANVWGEIGSLANDYVLNRNAVRPVINVTTDNGFTSGDGTASNPYIIN